MKILVSLDVERHESSDHQLAHWLSGAFQSEFSKIYLNSTLLPSDGLQIRKMIGLLDIFTLLKLNGLELPVCPAIELTHRDL